MTTTPQNAHTKRRRRARKFRRGLERGAEMQPPNAGNPPRNPAPMGHTTAAMSLQDQLAFERLIPERLRFEVTKWAIDNQCTPHRSGRPPDRAWSRPSPIPTQETQTQEILLTWVG
jgi:hypothetical protein